MEFQISPPVLPGRRPAAPVLHVGERHALLGLREVPGLRGQAPGQRLPDVEEGAGLRLTETA